jgi:NAD+ kinase
MMKTSSPSAFEHIVIATHPNIPQACEKAAQIAAFLEDRGIVAIHGSLYDKSLRTIVKKKGDLLIALGGDGTMLRAGHLCAPHHVPILGINIGKLGFLIEFKHNEWEDALSKVLAGSYWLENRMMLQAEQWRDEQKLGSWVVLNEVVVSRGRILRPVHLHTSVEGHFLTTYVADALIAATPTGATAYALAAGGPILPPELRNILLVPVAPHLSIDRAIVLPQGSSVSITVHTEHQAIISMDGQEPIAMEDGDSVNVRASDHVTQFVRTQDPGYFYRNISPQMYNNYPAVKTNYDRNP